MEGFYCEFTTEAQRHRGTAEVRGQIAEVVKALHKSEVKLQK
jgi:hypothetical protein